MAGGKEQDYWPGFVDALSNVVLTLVFVLVVFVFALILASNKVETKAMEMVREAQQKAERTESSEIVAELKKKLELAEAKIEELAKIDPLSIQEVTKKLEAEDKSDYREIGAVAITRTSNKIIIVFPKAVSDLDEGSLRELDRVLDRMKAQTQGKRITMHAYIGLESYSAARRLAYYRVLGLRNHLLVREEFKNTKVENKILLPKEREDGRVEIFFD